MQKAKMYDAIFFDLDDTLFNSTLMSHNARRNAIRAIIEAGLDVDEEQAFNLLLDIVKEYGSNYNKHFNRLLEKLEYPPHSKLIAAAVVAYHRTKQSLLRPFPDVVLTLLTLRKAFKIGIITDGLEIKQWEKLIYMGLEHFFDLVIINNKKSKQKPDTDGFKTAMKKLGIRNPKRLIYVGNKIDTDILGANKAKWISVLFDPKKIFQQLDLKEAIKKPNFVIHRISEITTIVGIEQIDWFE